VMGAPKERRPAIAGAAAVIAGAGVALALAFYRAGRLA
jgi:hypothetical protein